MKTFVPILFVFFLTKTNGLLHWLQNHLITCPFKQLFSIDCPGCGFQRSVLSLLQGDLVASFKFYPATLPIIFLLLFTVFHLKFDFKSGAFYIKMLYFGITLIIVINYLYKIFTNQLI